MLRRWRGFLPFAVLGWGLSASGNPCGKILSSHGGSEVHFRAILESLVRQQANPLASGVANPHGTHPEHTEAMRAAILQQRHRVQALVDSASGRALRLANDRRWGVLQELSQTRGNLGCKTPLEPLFPELFSDRQFGPLAEAFWSRAKAAGFCVRVQASDGTVAAEPHAEAHVDLKTATIWLNPQTRMQPFAAVPEFSSRAVFDPSVLLLMELLDVNFILNTTHRNAPPGYGNMYSGDYRRWVSGVRSEAVRLAFLDSLRDSVCPAVTFGEALMPWPADYLGQMWTFFRERVSLALGLEYHSQRSGRDLHLPFVLISALTAGGSFTLDEVQKTVLIHGYDLRPEVVNELWDVEVPLQFVMPD